MMLVVSFLFEWFDTQPCRIIESHLGRSLPDFSLMFCVAFPMTSAIPLAQILSFAWEGLPHSFMLDSQAGPG